MANNAYDRGDTKPDELIVGEVYKYLGTEKGDVRFSCRLSGSPPGDLFVVDGDDVLVVDCYTMDVFNELVLTILTPRGFVELSFAHDEWERKRKLFAAMS